MNYHPFTIHVDEDSLVDLNSRAETRAVYGAVRRSPVS